MFVCVVWIWFGVILVVCCLVYRGFGCFVWRFGLFVSDVAVGCWDCLCLWFGLLFCVDLIVLFDFFCFCGGFTLLYCGISVKCCLLIRLCWFLSAVFRLVWFCLLLDCFVCLITCLSVWFSSWLLCFYLCLICCLGFSVDCLGLLLCGRVERFVIFLYGV